MNYATTANRPNAAAMLGAVGVPAAFGAVLVAGLAVTGVINAELENPDTIFIDPKPLPDPPPPPEPTPQPKAAQQSQVVPVPRPPVSPQAPIDLGRNTPITTLPDPGPLVIDPIDFGGPAGPVTPPPSKFDPVGAAPRNDPGRWVTDGDYRSRWIREGLSGRASFALEIDANGKVSDCRITRSSGHSVLDEATCKLVQRRARFRSAKDGNGDAVAGTYSSTVNWRIPE